MRICERVCSICEFKIIPRKIEYKKGEEKKKNISLSRAAFKSFPDRLIELPYNLQWLPGPESVGESVAI